MKKRYLLPIFALAFLVSQAGAAEYCCWVGNSYNDNKGYCGPLANNPNCTDDYGDIVSSCSGCDVGSGDKDEGESCGSYCLWDTGCTAINTDPAGQYGNPITSCSAAIENCEANGSRYSDAACNNFVGGNDPNRQALGCCKWETESQCWTIWSGVDPSDGKDGSEKVSDCQGGSNQFWNGKCPSEGTCPSGPAPIQKVQPGIAGLIVVPYGRALHISSPKDASVTLYDLGGNRVFGGKVRAGNSVFSLTSQSPGVYYAVVRSGSLTQTANVVLK